MSTNIADALKYSTLSWKSKAVDKPSESTINTLKSELDFLSGRAQSYPPIGEQLDMLWHAIDEGKLDKPCDFYLKLKSVKDVYPKTSVGITTYQGNNDTSTYFTS